MTADEFVAQARQVIGGRTDAGDVGYGLVLVVLIAELIEEVRALREALQEGIS